MSIESTLREAKQDVNSSISSRQKMQTKKQINSENRGSKKGFRSVVKVMPNEVDKRRIKVKDSRASGGGTTWSPPRR